VPPTLSPALALTPLGQLRLVERDDAPPVADAVAAGLREGFGRGAARGLLALGLREVGVALPPPIAWWRDLAAGRRWGSRPAAGREGGGEVKTPAVAVNARAVAVRKPAVAVKTSAVAVKTRPVGVKGRVVAVKGRVVAVKGRVVAVKGSAAMGGQGLL